MNQRMHHLWVYCGLIFPLILASSGTHAQGCGTEVIIEVFGDTSLCEGEHSFLHVNPGFATYAWNIGTVTQSIVVDVAGIYCITVTDGLGCTGDTCITVYGHDSPDVSIHGEFVICSGHTTDLIAFPDNEPEAFIWSTGATTDAILVSVPGTYCVTVSDQNGCTGEACIDVLEDVLPQIDIGPPPLLCPGEHVLIECPSFAGYCELNGFPIEHPIEIGPGSYEFSVFSASGCSTSTFFEIDAGYTSESFYDTTFCGEDPIYFQGEVFYDPGSYEILLENAVGCDSVIHLAINAPEIIDSVSGNFANGTGYIGIIGVHGGASPYQYRWNTGSLVPELTGLFKGTYTVTITDSNGCTSVKSFRLPGFPRPDSDVELEIIVNPIHEEVLVQLRSLPSRYLHLAVFDYTGKLLGRFRLNDETEHFPLPKEAGVYILHLSDHRGTISSQKLIMLH